MDNKEIKEMIKGWIDDLNSGGFDLTNIPEEMRNKIEKMSVKEFNAYFDGHIDALQSVINSL